MVILLKRISQRHIRLILEGDLDLCRSGARSAEVTLSLVALRQLGVSYEVSSPAALRWRRQNLRYPLSAWFPRLLMKRTSKTRTAEVALGRRSLKVAEDESRLVARDLLDEAITKFLEWRAFAYWLRLYVETAGSVSDSLAAILQERCPGFLDYAAAYGRRHPGDQEFLWLRFLEWTDEKLFQTPIAEGWRHALGYYAMRDPRMDQLRAHWKRSRRAWKLHPPAVLPSFESWRASAFPIR